MILALLRAPCRHLICTNHIGVPHVRSASRSTRLPRPARTGQNCHRPDQACRNRRDLALAYSPGVAEPVREIAANPADAYRYTGKGNLVAVISNGTAILGLGNLGRSPPSR